MKEDYMFTLPFSTLPPDLPADIETVPVPAGFFYGKVEEVAAWDDMDWELAWRGLMRAPVEKVEVE